MSGKRLGPLQKHSILNRPITFVCSHSPAGSSEIMLEPCRVPEECPAWVAELITSCMLENPAARPTSKEIYRMLLEGNGELA